MPARRISLVGTRNLRDIGGLSTEDKRITRFGVLYRGDQLSAVDEEDAEDILVDQLCIHRSYDLRGPSEAASKMYSFRGIERIATPMPITSVYDRYSSIKPVTVEHVKKLMVELCTFCIEKYGRIMGEVLHDIAARGVSDTDAVLVHCTLGKDRTGLLCAILLKILGVKEEDIMKNYLETNQYISAQPSSQPGGRRKSYTLAFEGDEALQAFYAASPEFLLTLNALVEEHGGIHSFAINELGVSDADIEKLRNFFLK